MNYGAIKVDTVTFTDAGIDKSVTLSGLVQNPTFSGNVTVTGTFSGVTVTGTTANFTSGNFINISGGTFSGVTVTGTTANFTSGNFINISGGTFSGVTVTGTTANFTSGNFINISGGTHTIASGVFAAGSATNPSITFTGDLNTGIYSPSPGADQIAISTGGTGRLFVDASGNVTVNTNTFYVDATNNRIGIGTTSPSTLLHLAADNPVLRLEDTTGGTQSDYEVEVSSSLFQIKNVTVATTPIVVNNSGTTTLTSAASTAPFIANIGASEVARIDSSGRLLVGTSTARTNFNNTTQSGADTVKQVIEGADGGYSASLALVSNRAGTGNSGSLIFAKSNGTALNSNTLVSSDTSLGTVSFQGSDGTEFVAGATIQAFVDGIPGANDMPGRIVLSTTPDGTFLPTERMRIDSAGAVRIGSAGTLAAADRLLIYESGVTTRSTVASIENPTLGDGHAAFYDVTANTAGGSERRAYLAVQKQAGQTNPCAVLYMGTQDGANNYHWIDDNDDLRIGTNAQVGTTGGSRYAKDYEEGTWTPTAAQGFTSPTYGANTAGIYTKVGNIVRIHGRLVLTGGTATASTIRIGGLPFTCQNTATQYVTCAYYLNAGAGTIGNALKPLVVPGQTYIEVFLQNNTNVTGVAGTTLGNTMDILFSATYQV